MAGIATTGPTWTCIVVRIEGCMQHWLYGVQSNGGKWEFGSIRIHAVILGALYVD